jgi:GntR family transcriptional regulator
MNDKVDLYIRIKTHIERLIQRGAFLEGEALPSVRKIAMDMGVNPNTVMKSYQALEMEGLIEIIPKKGAFVKSYPVSNHSSLSQLDSIIDQLRLAHQDEDIIKYIKSLLGGKQND